jgi:phage-related minor tail protein
MQVYLKRGYQGKLKESADSMGRQFSPGYTTGHEVTISSSNTTETTKDQMTTTEILDQRTNKTGNETVADSKQEFWWK